MTFPILHPSLRFLLIVALLGLNPIVASAADEPSATPEQLRFFETQVRPILVESCNGCHGASKVKAGLRLDSREAMVTGGDSGPSVVPGEPEQSPLIAAIRYEGPEMPPKGKLPPKQVEALTRWVKMGAPWTKEAGKPAVAAVEGESNSNIRKPGYKITPADRAHWAFRPLQTPAVPAHGCPNPIDNFLAAGRAPKHLDANPPATRAELIRRATYDLTGLPPIPDEVRAFVASTDPDAYPKLIDRLLASPRYGEKWGRHWLDLVRYAETNSYERDGVKPNAWRFRDYVIQAFNDDKPYDQFIREQLAGDELPDTGIAGKIATGYYRLGLWDDEPADRDQARYDEYDDIVATTGQVFLGLTVDCARCHDHKLDPIPQKDYYRFLSFFRNVNSYRNGGPTDEIPFFSSPEAKQQFEVARRELATQRNDIQANLTGIEREFQSAYAHKQGGAVSTADIDDLKYRYYRDTWEELPDFDALKPEETGILPDGLFDLSKRSRNESIGFVWEGSLVVPTTGQYTFSLASDDGSKLRVGGKVILENDGIHGEETVKTIVVDLQRGRVPIRLDYFQATHGLGLHVTWAGPDFTARPLATGNPDEADPKAKNRAANNFARLLRREGAEVIGKAKVNHYFELRKELDKLKKQDVPADRALVVTEVSAEPLETAVMLRGNPHSPGDKVEPAFIEVVSNESPILNPPVAGSKTTGRRLALANWIASPTNPLTARVMANRVWQYHFGRGIVRSASNLGTQGDKPTHPELLDWLASELIRNQWHLKPLHREIMLSQAYQMASDPNPTALAADPTNDTFWRFDMRRLTSEEIRDSILAVTGQLNTKMYGPGVYPEIPDEVKAGQSVPGAGWHKSSLEDQNRRSIYVHVKRSLLLPILESFDQAETDRSSPVRFATTQPTQALGMINGSFMNDQAVALAGRVRHEAGGSLAARVKRVLELVTDREPSPGEVERGVGLMTDLQRDGIDADQALETFCLVALNLDEFIYLD